MKLQKSRIAWLLSLFVSVSLLAGCGTGGDNVAGPSGGALPVSSDNWSLGSPGFDLNPAPFRRALGGMLEGTPVVAYDEDNLQVQQALPAKVDLRLYMSPVGDQGLLQACSAFAIVKGLREYMLNRNRQPFTSLSAGFLWYLARKEMGWPDENQGAYISVGMKILENIGTDTEAGFPYPTPAEQQNPRLMKVKISQAPTPQQIQAAGRFHLAGGQPANSLLAIRKSLAAGYPVVIGIFIYDSFYRIGSDAIAPVPNPDQEKQQGSHIVAVAGYDNARQVFIVKNSWGPNWGDHGYFFLPYQFIKLGIARDAWTIKPH